MLVNIKRESGCHSQGWKVIDLGEHITQRDSYHTGLLLNYLITEGHFLASYFVSILNLN